MKVLFLCYDGKTFSSHNVECCSLQFCFVQMTVWRPAARVFTYPTFFSRKYHHARVMENRFHNSVEDFITWSCIICDTWDLGMEFTKYDKRVNFWQSVKYKVSNSGTVGIFFVNYPNSLDSTSFERYHGCSARVMGSAIICTKFLIGDTQLVLAYARLA